MSAAGGARGLAGHLLCGACLALLCAFAPPGVPAALAVVLVLVLPVAWMLALRRPWQESRPLLWLFLAAVGLRLVVASVLSLLSAHQIFSLDDYKYAYVGQQLAEYWAGRGAYPELLTGRAVYYQWNALLYTVFGFHPLVPSFANAVAGGLACVMAYPIARELGGHRAGLLAAGFTAFWPSLVLWSSLNLKDAFAILAILIMLRGAQRMQTRWGLAPVAWTLIGLVGLTSLRGYLGSVAGATLALAWLLPRLRAAPVLGVALLVLAAVLVPMVAPLQELTDEASLESLDRMRRHLAVGASAYQSNVDISTPTGALAFLPTGLAYFLLTPAPWQLWNARQFLTFPEMFVWYALIPQVAFGLAFALRSRFAAAAPVAIFAFLTTLSYALVEGNLGTAFRHRAQVLVLLLIFASVGIFSRRAARGAAAENATAPPDRACQSADAEPAPGLRELPA